MGRVTHRGATADHLATIDAHAWPGVAALPGRAASSWRGRAAEAGFAKAAAKAGLRLDGEDPDLVVHHAEVFARIADSGWIGLAEGYLAGEWSTETSGDLVRVLRGLIEAKYRPRTLRISPVSRDTTLDVPPALVAHFSGDGTSAFQGHFGTGVPTRERVRVKSFVRGAGRGNEPARHFVDRTEWGAPLDAARPDLSDAQARSAALLIDAAGVTQGTHLLVNPSAGGALAAEAAGRGATVDCIAPNDAAAQALRERLVYEGPGDAVRVEVAGRTGGGRGTYDAVVSAEHLETLAPKAKAAYLREVEASLQPGGRAAMQTIVRTPAMTGSAAAALESLRAYVWPGLSYSSPEELLKLVDANSGLRIVAESHAPEHLAMSLGLQRTTFDANLRDAAADGFDPVYRRLWTWQLALREALAQLGMLSLVQLGIGMRNRRGRR